MDLMAIHLMCISHKNGKSFLKSASANLIVCLYAISGNHIFTELLTGATVRTSEEGEVKGLLA